MRNIWLGVSGAGALLVVLCCAMPLAANAQKVIIDTDFAVPPQDDALAVLLALQSPEIEILGFTTVMGNRSRKQATSDLLRVLEIVERTHIPVCEGANLPLLHRKSDFAVKAWGEWYSDALPPAPPGGFAKIQPRGEVAAEFLRRVVLENPGEITIIALGPLTNLANAISGDPRFSAAVKRIVIMGGAIASLPDGWGNQTPNAEFNFWVDPEAASLVMKSGIPIELSPLNVSRKTRFTRGHFEHITSADTPISNLLKETMSQRFRETDRVYLMYDQVAVAAVIDPTLVKTQELIVAVDTNLGVNYGVSVGGTEPWPGVDGSGLVRVQYDLDWERFIKLFVDRLSATP